MRLPSPFVFNAVVDIVTCFFDTDLSVIISSSVIEFLTEGSRYRDYSVRYSNCYFENF